MENLRTLLSSFGFDSESSLNCLPKRIEGAEKDFIKWLTGELETCTQLTGETKNRFNEMRRRGCCYTESEISEHKEKVKQMNEEMADTSDELILLKDNLQTLNNLHSNLSSEYRDCLMEQEKLSGCLSSCQREYSQINDELKSLNTQMNTALSRMDRAVGGVMSVYQSERCQEARTHDLAGETTPISLADCSQSLYHGAESKFLKELTDFTKQQFTPNIKEMVADLSCTEETLLDVSMVDGHGLEDNTAYKKHKLELERLRNIIPLCEMQSVDCRVMVAYLEAAVERAEQELTTVLDKRNEKTLLQDTNQLRGVVEFTEGNVSDLIRQLEGCVERRLGPLILDLVTLQVDQLTQGDHDMKLARQSSFINKQDQIIGYLSSQRARYELLSMLLEADFNRHRKNYQLLTAAKGQLQKWVESSTQRMKDFESAQSDQSSSENYRQHSSDDVTTSLPGVENMAEALLQTDQSVTMKEKAILSLVSKQHEIINDRISLYTDVHWHVYGQNGTPAASISFRPTVYEASVSNVERVLGTLEEKIKKVLKEHDSKKKVLLHNPLLQTERSLYVHFFTNPGYLQHLMADLTTKIDTRAIISSCCD